MSWRQLAVRPASAGEPGGQASVTRAFDRRHGPTRQLEDQAAEITRAAHAMAARFDRGGKLVVFGAGAASPDAQHVAVEFIHPVIVGKRALPAISLTSDAATVTAVASREGVARIFSYQIEELAEPGDIALGIARDGDCASVIAGLRAARDIGLLTVALLGGHADSVSANQAADHLLTSASDDPLVVKEVQVTSYHILWELVHVFLEQPAALAKVAGQ